MILVALFFTFIQCTISDGLLEIWDISICWLKINFCTCFGLYLVLLYRVRVFLVDLPNYPKMNLIVLRFMILSGSSSAKSSSSVCLVRFSISLKFYGLVSGNIHENNLISMKLLVNSWASFHWKTGSDFRFYHVAITLRLWWKIHSRKIHCREKKNRMKKNSISQTFWDQINELDQLKLD